MNNYNNSPQCHWRAWNVGHGVDFHALSIYGTCDVSMCRGVKEVLFLLSQLRFHGFDARWAGGNKMGKSSRQPGNQFAQ